MGASVLVEAVVVDVVEMLDFWRPCLAFPTAWPILIVRTILVNWVVILVDCVLCRGIGIGFASARSQKLLDVVERLEKDVRGRSSRGTNGRR